MSLLDERGTGAISWQRNLAVLWCGVFLACASYTMVVPFLPVYLLQELHVESSEVNFWSGLVYSVTFLGASIMARIGGQELTGLVSGVWRYVQDLVSHLPTGWQEFRNRRNSF